MGNVLSQLSCLQTKTCAQNAATRDVGQATDLLSGEGGCCALQQKHKRVLLVEADMFFRFMMREIIKSLEISVDVASDGLQCCDMLEKEEAEYALILLDVNILSMGGVDMVRSIRKVNVGQPTRHLPIYAVTDTHSLVDIEKVIGLGFDGVIDKPISPGELLGLVDTFCFEN